MPVCQHIATVCPQPKQTGITPTPRYVCSCAIEMALWNFDVRIDIVPKYRKKFKHNVCSRCASAVVQDMNGLKIEKGVETHLW